MAVQSDDLIALGLGITGDTPPAGSLQPTPLADGIHIQYRTSPGRGIPWYGFYLLRRRHRPAPEKCLAPQLIKGWPRGGKETSRRLEGCSLHASTAIGLATNSGVAEIPLTSAPLEARFDEAPVHRVVATLGFPRLGRGKDGEGRPEAGPAPGEPILRPADPPVLRPAPRAKPEPARRADLHVRPAPATGVRMIARYGGEIVAETLISGLPGRTVSGAVEADRIDSVELHPAVRLARNAPPYAALKDLCWTSVARALPGRWAPVPAYPNPMPLPVAHGDYPCAGRPASPAAAQNVALARIRYDSPAHWSPRFPELHGILAQLVAGGPAGPPMTQRKATFADAAAADPDATPKLADENLLELLALASLHPTVAQMLGLYWVDGEVEPGRAYDYLVLADHSNAFQGKVQAAVAAANGGAIPSGVDAWINFDHVAQPRPRLALPDGPRAYVLPDTAISGDMSAPRGAVGLGWAPPSPAPGAPAADAPVRYIIWRRDYGAAPPGASGGPFVPINPDAPRVAGIGTSAAAAALMPKNWPPLPLNAVERRLADGWYGFRLSTICLFGRHTPPGGDGSWWQWKTPDPLPWYYQPPPADRQLHAFAVEIRDMLPPPAPAFVEATALDPADEDSYVRDAAFDAWWSAVEPWWSGLTDAERAAALPLRVRWRWHPSQEALHPNTTHFRIYFNPGSLPPGPDPADPAHWQDRIFVCDYGYCTQVPATATHGPYRQYEVLLPRVPPPGAPPFPGVPLQPGLGEPVVYANVAVTAANSKTFGADHPKWTGTPWGGLVGIEGRAASAKIYRVWRTPPPAPASLNDDERVWATKADFHSRSFRTLRWPASPDLKAHVYAVMDSTLFMVERMEAAATILTPADTAALQTLWPTVPANVTAELTALRALKPSLDNSALPQGDPQRKLNDSAWAAACAALGDGALRGLAALPLHEDSYLRQTVEPVDPSDAAGPDDPAGYVPNSAWRAWRATFDGRARNRYFLRAAYVDAAHNEGEMGPPDPPIYLPPAVPPRTPVITRVTGGDRQATIAWTTAGAEVGGRYVLYRTDDDYRLRDVRLMEEAAVLFASELVLNSNAEAEWVDGGLQGGKTYHYSLVFLDESGNASAPSRPTPVNVVDESLPDPPAWIGQSWLIEHEGDGVLADWPADGIVPPDHAPVLRLIWASGVAQPAFVVTRRERYGQVWNAPPETDAIVESAAEAGQYSWIDRNADPERLWEYRLRVRASSGLWSNNSTQMPVAPPLPVEVE